MSVERGEINSTLEGEVVDPIYSDFQSVLDGLPGTGSDLVDRYDGFQSQEELINYVIDVLELGNDDLNRFLEEYEDPCCPYCEVFDEDPSMESFENKGERDSRYREDKDKVNWRNLELTCGTHINAFIKAEWTWYE